MGLARSVVEVDVADGDSLVVVHGPLDRSAALRLERAVRMIDRSGQVVVDLGDVPRATRRGVRALATLGDDARAAGGRLSLREVSDPVLRIVEAAGVDADAEGTSGTTRRGR
jgi:anti-anti-sigma regulatory factor